MSKKTYSFPAERARITFSEFAERELKQMTSGLLNADARALEKDMARDFFDLLNRPSESMLHAAQMAATGRTYASSCFPRMYTLDTCSVHSDAQMTMLGECVARLRAHPPEGDVEKLLAEIEMRNFPIPLIATAQRRRMQHSEGWVVDLTIQMSVLDRDTRVRTMVMVPVRFEKYDRGPDPDRDLVHGLVYTALRQAVVHELDEAWHVRGERVNDPHRNDPL